MQRPISVGRPFGPGYARVSVAILLTPWSPMDFHRYSRRTLLPGPDLNDRERAVLDLRFGYNGKSRDAHIAEIEAKALAKLREQTPDE